MPRTYDEWLKTNEACIAHIDKLNAAGVTWEDLADRREVDRKLDEYDKRQTTEPRKSV